MRIDIQDVLFWMDAIRNSDDRYRTLESFWKGQVNSKVWLVDLLKVKYVNDNARIIIYGGWNGVLASILFNSSLSIEHITSVDIDPNCEEIANTVNKNYEIAGRFKAVTADMCTYVEPADIVINTSCEHVTQEQYDQWLNNQSNDTLFVIQSNNYFDLDEHIRCAADLDEFIHMSKIEPYYRGEFKTPKYTRYMIIGKKKNV
jgi:spermidine synthase